VHQLVMDGATVAGPKPTDDPSLADSQSEFQTLVNELFGEGTGAHHVGKGIVYAGQSVAEALAAMNVPPDFSYTDPGAAANLQFVHRHLADGDIYFVDNRSGEPANVDATFRVAGRVPELWHAETGKIEPLSYTIADDRTRVPLHLEPWGTVFLVFQRRAVSNSVSLPVATESEVATVNGPWTVAFQPGRGAPESITMTELSDWSRSENPGVKYFSGEATYATTVEAPPEWFAKGTRLWIDLGDVRNLAVVSVNGKELGESWHAPYRVDATEALRQGANDISIKVVNAWVNRLIGDEQPNATKFTFADVKPYKADSPLLPSGLLGPVKILRQRME
jgi:hypothetical protein